MLEDPKWGIDVPSCRIRGHNPTFGTDPDHDGLARIDSDIEHVTAGVGIAIGRRFHLDFAAHFSDLVDETMLGVSFDL